MDGPSGAMVVGAFKTVGDGGAGTISPCSQIDSGTDSMSLTFKPAPASLSFNKDIGAPPTSPSATDTCDRVVATVWFFSNASVERSSVMISFRFRRSRRVFRCAARESVPMCVIQTMRY